MAHLIDKDVVLAEIERIENLKQDVYKDRATRIAWEAGKSFALIELTILLDTLEVTEVNLEKSIDADSMVTEYLKQYEEAGQTPFAMNIIGSAYRKGLEDMFRLKAQKGKRYEKYR